MFITGYLPLYIFLGWTTPARLVAIVVLLLFKINMYTKVNISLLKSKRPQIHHQNSPQKSKL
jgi:hypothetical protein